MKGEEEEEGNWRRGGEKGEQGERDVDMQREDEMIMRQQRRGRIERGVVEVLGDEDVEEVVAAAVTSGKKRKGNKKG